MDPTQWHAPFWVVVLALFAIVELRANGTYWLGRLASTGVHRTRLARMLDSPAYLKACERIDRFGAPVVALSFLTIGFQTLANLAAGATSMKLRHYLPAVIIGGTAWALLYATLGTVGFDLLGRLWNYSPMITVVALVVVIAAIAAYVIVQARRRPEVVAGE
jgi:membrane protein DedA with SNARE-associated domain